MRCGVVWRVVAYGQPQPKRNHLAIWLAMTRSDELPQRQHVARPGRQATAREGERGAMTVGASDSAVGRRWLILSSCHEGPCSEQRTTNDTKHTRHTDTS